MDFCNFCFSLKNEYRPSPASQFHEYIELSEITEMYERPGIHEFSKHPKCNTFLEFIDSNTNLNNVILKLHPGISSFELHLTFPPDTLSVVERRNGKRKEGDRTTDQTSK